MRSNQPTQRRDRGLSDKGACLRPRRMTAGCALGIALLAWVPAGALAARAADPLHAPQCLRAQAELDAALAAADARHGVRLARARQAALQACLGTDTGRRERAGAPEPVRTVPPPLAGGHAPALPPAIAPPPPASVERPAAITGCDPSGCWDSRGRRLNQAGPLLMGPNGLCTVQAGLVTCP